MKQLYNIRVDKEMLTIFKQKAWETKQPASVVIRRLMDLYISDPERFDIKQ